MGSGTSAASPVATAAYVLLKERFPELRHEIIIDAMKLTGKVLEKTQFTNLRMVDIPAAIDYLDANETALANGTLVIDQEEISPKHRAGLVPAQFLSTPPPLSRLTSRRRKWSSLMKTRWNQTLGQNLWIFWPTRLSHEKKLLNKTVDWA